MNTELFQQERDMKEARARNIYHYLALQLDLSEESAAECYRSVLVYTHSLHGMNKITRGEKRKEIVHDYIREVTHARKLMEKIHTTSVKEMVEDIKHLQREVYHRSLLQINHQPHLEEARLQHDVMSSALALSISCDLATRVQLATDTFCTASRYSVALTEIHKVDGAIPQEIMDRYKGEVSAPLQIMDSLGNPQIRNYVSILGNMLNRISKTPTY